MRCRAFFTAANILTAARIVLSLALFFTGSLSPLFYILYIAAGLTDMADGAAARRTGTVSVFGAELDTAADFVFAAVCLVKLLPVIRPPAFLLAATAAAAALKTVSLFVPHRTHTVPDKLAGGALFIFPLVLSFADIRITGTVAASAALFAAVYDIAPARRGARGKDT